jgi:hypothetical protein
MALQRRPAQGRGSRRIESNLRTPEKATLSELYDDDLIPKFVCQQFRYNQPVTTKMLVACFDPDENIALRHEIKMISFRINELIFKIMQFMLATI